MNNITWDQFCEKLLELMEQRQSKANAFRLNQIYYFMNQCSWLFRDPGSSDAQEFKQIIANQGTFLLVADTLADFWALFPPNDTPADNADVVAEEAREAREEAEAEPPPPRRPQPGPDARGRSGRPFRR